MADFSHYNDTRPTRPASNLRVVTIAGSPDVDYVLPGGVAKALYVNNSSGGHVGIIAEDDAEAVTWKMDGPGIIPVRVKAIRPSTTTATDLIALY
jgi:hypothetical protein